MACTEQMHRALKAHIDVWLLWTEPPSGLAKRPIMDDGSGGAIELGNCKACSSTLALQVDASRLPLLACVP